MGREQWIVGPDFGVALEAAEDDEEEPNKRERAPVDNSWITLTTVHDLLGHTKSAERSNLESKAQSKVSKYANQIEAAKSISERLWSVPDEEEAIKGSLDKQGSFVENHSADTTGWSCQRTFCY